MPQVLLQAKALTHKYARISHLRVIFGVQMDDHDTPLFTHELRISGKKILIRVIQQNKGITRAIIYLTNQPE